MTMKMLIAPSHHPVVFHDTRSGLHFGEFGSHVHRDREGGNVGGDRFGGGLYIRHHPVDPVCLTEHRLVAELEPDIQEDQEKSHHADG